MLCIVFEVESKYFLLQSFHCCHLIANFLFTFVSILFTTNSVGGKLKENICGPILSLIKFFLLVRKEDKKEEQNLACKENWQ